MSTFLIPAYTTFPYTLMPYMTRLNMYIFHYLAELGAEAVIQ
jgi:hypothetical protein